MSHFFLPVVNFSGFFPVYLLVILGIAAILLDVFIAPEKRRSWVTAFGIAAAGMALLMTLLASGSPEARAFAKASIPAAEAVAKTSSHGEIRLVGLNTEPVAAVSTSASPAMISLDNFTRPILAIALLGGFLFMLLGRDLVSRRKMPAGEFVALALFAVAGAAFLAVSQELLVVFLSIEIVSICMYVLIAMDRKSRRASEAAFKYFILGSFASALLVLGMGFIFGATGSTYFEDIRVALMRGSVEGALLFVGIALVFCALCFKLALAPFHMYAPDVYEGSSAVVAGLVATVVKVAGFAVLSRLVQIMALWHGPHNEALLQVVWGIAALSIVVGNVGGLLQTNIKRMLGYSSVAHSGYLMLAILTIFSAASKGNADLVIVAQRAMLVYLVGYTAMNLLAFGAAGAMGRRGEENIADYAGLSRRQPALAAAMAVAMISLTGIPPTLGFFGKYMVFSALVQAGFVRLAVLAILFSVISAAYYLRVVIAMYMRPAESEVELEKPSTAGSVALAISAAVVLILGCFPNLILGRLM